MSFKVEATDGSGYASNGLRFRTREGAEAYGVDLAYRWLSLKDWRVVSSADEVTDSDSVKRFDNPTSRCDDPGQHQPDCQCDGGEPRF